jgi:ATP-binding cassette, subfamily B, bacterial IrtA/YbtP
MTQSTELTPWQIIQPVRSRIYIAMAMAAASTVAGIISWVQIPHIAELLLKQADAARIWQGVMMAIGGATIALISRVFAFHISHLAAFKLEEILRLRLMEHIATLPLGFVMNAGSGTIKKIVQDDVKALHVFVADTTPLIARSYVTPIVMIAVMLWADWRMLLVSLLLVPMALFTMSLAMKDYPQRRREFDQANEQVNQSIVEFVQGMPVVRTFDDGSSSFGRFQQSLDRFTRSLDAWVEDTVLPGRIGVLLFEALPILTIVIGVGSWGLLQGWLEFSTWVLFLVLAPGLMASFHPLMLLSYHLNQSSAASKRLGALLDQPSLVQPVQSQTPQDASLRFEHVQFAYNDRLVLQDIDLTFPANTVTALVGPSGAGKSTIARLIPRFWDVTSGAIQLGGVNIRDLDQDTLMSWVSFVFQETFLMDGTIGENIALGRPEASLADIAAAAKAAQIHGFIAQLPDGYDTIVGERGARLSGGERQRVTIARAILQNNPIIVLDEATAFADPENAQLIQQAIAQLTQDKTLIIVAHRLSTIANADQIVVLDRGRIVERGKHRDLLRLSGLYARLWHNQQQARDWSIRIHASEE